MELETVIEDDYVDVESTDEPAASASRSSTRVARLGRKRPIRRKKKKATPVAEPAEEAVEPPEPVDSYTALVVDFEAAIDDLAQREGLENLHTEFARVFRRLEETRQREADLVARVAQLDADLAQEKARAGRDAAHGGARWRAEQARADAVKALEEEVAALREQCDLAATREHAALETLDGVRRQLLQAQQEVRASRGMGEEIQDMAHEKRVVRLARERDLLQVKLDGLQDRLQKSQALQEDLQHRASATDLRLAEAKKALEHETDRKQREMDARATLETEYRAMQSELEAKKNELSHAAMQHRTAAARASRLEATVAELTDANDSLTKESAELAQRVAELKSLLRRRNVDLENAVTNWQDATAQLHQVEGGLSALESKVNASESLNKALGADLDKARSRVATVLLDTARSRLEERTLQRSLNETKMDLAAQEQAVRALASTKDTLEKRIKRLTTELNGQVDVVAKKNVYIKELERCIEAGRVAQERLGQQLDAMRRARQRLDGELTTMRRRAEGEAEYAFCERQEAVRCKRDLAQCEDKVAALKLRQDANERTTVVLGRQAAAAIEREDNMREQVKELTSLTEQLKEEVLKREHEVQEEKHRREASEVAQAQVLAQVDRLQAEAASRREEMADLRLELKESEAAVRELTADLDAEAKVKEAALNERDIFGTQVSRRNDEIRLLRLKVDVLERALQAGGRELGCTEEAVRLLKLEVRRLRWERTLLARNIAAMPRLEQELYHAVQDLCRTQHLARALEDELSTPVNFHRWRRLEGSDLPHLEALAKVRLLQRRLIAKSENMLVQEARIRETEKLYLQLRESCARQPASPTALLMARAALHHKQRKIKGLLAEVTLSESAYTQLEKANKEISKLKSASKQPKLARLPIASAS